MKALKDFDFKTEFNENTFWNFSQYEIPAKYVITAADVALMIEGCAGEDPSVKPDEIYDLLVNSNRGELVESKLILMSIKVDRVNNMMDLLTKEHATQEIVDALLKASPDSLSYNQQSYKRSIIGDFITQAHCDAYVKAGGYDLDSVQWKFQNKEMALQAASNGLGCFHSIADKVRDLELLISCGKRASLHTGADFSDYGDNLEKAWGFTKKALTGLLKDSIIPSFDKVPTKDLKGVRRASYLAAFKRDKSVIETMPEEIKAFITPEQALKVVYIELIQHLPKNLITDEVIEAYQKDFNGNLSTAPSEYLTYEMCERAVQKDSTRISEVPERFIDVHLCDIAMEDSSERLKDLPEEFKEQFYAKAAKGGWGFEQIPEDKRTDKLCTIAVEALGENLEFVPEGKKSYAIVLSAVEKDCRAYEFIPEGFEDDDHEVKIRTIISFLKGEHFYRDSKTKIIKEILEAYSNYSSDRENLIVEVVKREPKLFIQLSDCQRYSDEFKCFTRKSVCLAAFKGDQGNISHVPQEVLASVFKEYVDLIED